jgi:diguanylate cyclase (GGDEF)-like protein
MPTDPVSFRQSLLELLEANPPHEEALLAELDRRGEEGQPLYSSILYILTHLTFSETEARKHFARVVAHRDLLRMELRRDLGLRVALLDYFVNVNRELKNPKVIEISIYERTERSAVTDGLTGLYNHAYFVQGLRREVQRSKRHQHTVSLAMFDLDNFKKLNDTYGHVGGDKILMKAAALIKESLREIDLAARYGGEEFAVILPDTTRNGAFVVADRIRAKIEEHFRKKRGGPSVTVSGGVASYPDDALGIEDLVKRADEGLYRSKAEGKNRITLAQGERRRHLRVPVARPATLSPASGPKASAKTKNVSEGGLLVSLKQEVPVGSAVSLVIRPKNAPAVAVRGEVARVEKIPGRPPHYDVGVRLDQETPKNLLVLHIAEPASRA